MYECPLLRTKARHCLQGNEIKEDMHTHNNHIHTHAYTYVHEACTTEQLAIYTLIYLSLSHSLS